MLLVGTKQVRDPSLLETAALVLDCNEDAGGYGFHAKHHASARTSELDGVLQEIAHDRREDLSVRVDRERLVARNDRQVQVARLEVQGGGGGDLFEEAGQHDVFGVLDAGREAHLGEGAIDRVAQAQQAAPEHGARAPVDANRRRFQDCKGRKRRMGQIPQLVSQEAEAFGCARSSLVDERTLSLPRVLRDGAGDRIVEALVERAKVLGRDRDA
jgi:hypothetical protein